MVDLAIAFAIVGGSLVGWRKGVITPFVTLSGTLLGLALVYGGPLAGLLPKGPVGLLATFGVLLVAGSVLASVGSGLTALASRVGAVRGFDQALGVPLGAVMAAVTVYVVLIGTLTLDGWLDPLHRTTALRPKDVQALQATVAANPAAAPFADPAALQAIAASAARGPVSIDDLGKYDAVLAFYETGIRPSLRRSRFAPLVLAAGEQLPVIGRHVDFPPR